MAGAASDRSVNKIALCGAIFAGVAYVGYSVVKQAFGRTFTKSQKRKGEEGAVLDYESHRRKIYLRRLSGSGMSAMATEILLRNQESHNGNRDIDETGQLIFRPLSVQERIRELNLRARLFSDTIMAVQINENYQRPTAFTKNGHAISLQPSPLQTPRPSSPVNYSPYLSMKLSSDSVSLDTSVSNGFGSLKRRQSRRSLQRSHLNSDVMSREDLDECVDKEAEKLLDEREAELQKRLLGFENGSAKILTPYEAKSLVALLHTKDCDILERVLVTLSNCAAFSLNQDHLRDAGCLVRLQHLIVHSDLSVKLAAIRATGNMAINNTNQKEMEQFVPLLLMHLNPSKFEHDHDSLLIQRTLFTLTNIAVLNDWHFQMNDFLDRIFELARSSNLNLSTQALRLLINLSTNDEMVPGLVKSDIFKLFDNLMRTKLPDDSLLRLLTLFYNVLTASERLKTAANMESNATIDSDLRENLLIISRLHSNDDIRSKAKAITERFV